MRFWDASALVPLFVAEAGSRLAADLYQFDPQVVVWTLTRVEVLSALARRSRESAADRRSLDRARTELLSASERWVEISQVFDVRAQAERFVEKYPLRAADALQLSAAVIWADGEPASLDFVTLDLRLGEAARSENFKVLGVTV